MLKLPGYQIVEQIYAGTKTLVYRGQRLIDQQRVIIKILESDRPSDHDRRQILNQYAILQDLAQLDAGVDLFIQPYSVEPYRDGYALVMEDFGGISLKAAMQLQWRGGLAAIPNGLQIFFTIALQIASALDQLYRCRIIHKDIKPANLLIHPETHQIKLIDFSIATRLAKEVQELQAPNVLEGTLAYLSPEQTGRMNRGIDYRTDFYSLGVTLYELLTGQLPFIATDPMELIYCHLAQQPPVAHHHHPTIPAIVSKIIRKLMAKNAEDRYQSTFGLKHDLELCWHQWQDNRGIEAFSLGQQDVVDRLIVPETLYGRETEIETLQAAFERVVQGHTEMMLIAGVSGIGKTAIVDEIRKPITRQHGYFIRGKYDQLQRDIPFSAIVQAFRDLVGQLLTESRSQVEQWKVQVLDAVEENGQVIIDIIPEVEWLIGKQPTLAELDPVAAQNRFHRVFQKFIQVFPSPDHPLVLFLDDLQWADAASLKLIQFLMSDSTARHLLLIGAYRNNEVSPTHPLMLAIEQIEHSETTIHSIALEPLDQAVFGQWIADTVRRPKQEVYHLTQLIFAKTQGNPFFTTQLLKVLYEEGAIALNTLTKTWQWNLEQIKTLSLTDDVVEFLRQQLQKLPKATQTVLAFAAYIGNRFDLETLAVVYEASPEEISVQLWTAVQEGLILLKNNQCGLYRDLEHTPADSTCNAQIKTTNQSGKATYQFLHDRVQQAAYSLIPDDRRSKIHLEIGQLLLRRLSETELEEKIFDTVNQLNKGASLLVDQTERHELARLNLTAGRKAKAASAYQTSLNYLKTGIQLLAKDCWQTEYDLTLSLYSLATQVAYSNGDFEPVQQLAEVVLHAAKTSLDRIPVYEIKLLAYVSQNQLSEALEIGQQALQQLEVEISVSPTASQLDQAFAQTAALIAETGIEALLALPIMTDETLLAAMQILNSMLSAAYLISPPLFSLIVLQQVQLSIVHGNAPLSACAYATYGLLLCSRVNDLESGYQFGQLALSLASTCPDLNIRVKVAFIVANFTTFWKLHLKESLPLFQSGYQDGLNVGDLEYAAWSYYGECESLYLLGQELTDLNHKVAIHRVAIQEIKQDVVLDITGMLHQVVLNLVGDAATPTCLSGTAWDEQKFLATSSSGNPVNRLLLHWHKLILNYLFEQPLAAIEQAEIVESLLNQAAGRILLPLFYFYDSLTCLALDCTVQRDSQPLARVSANQQKMQEWAHHAPMNFLHKYYLVEAERCRVSNQYTEAIELYDRAIALAKENGYLNEEALACELAAKFYLAWEKPFIAEAYLQAAYETYDRWGATAKLDHLEQRYPQFIQSTERTSAAQTTIDHDKESAIENPIPQSVDSLESIRETTTRGSTSISESLDLKAILKASQALSVEIELEKLLTILMQVLIKNAGAQSGALILHRSQTFVIEAQAVSNADGMLDITCLQSIPVYSSDSIPRSLINYVSRSEQTLVIEDAKTEKTFAADPYIAQMRPKSIICAPIQNQGKLLGILYLENRLVRGMFTRDRLEVLKLLTTQAAISLENAMLYDDLTIANTRLEDYSRTLERKVEQRTQELNEKNQALQQTLQELQGMQTQLIQAEKMSSLGQMVAGIAHEINNPINFIHANIDHVAHYAGNLLDLIELYQQTYPDAQQELQDKIEDIDLEFLKQDVPALLKSMKTGSDRICKIVLGLRNFSRLDEADMKPVDLHEGIDSTLMILQHKFKTEATQPDIEIIKDYATLPKVTCYASQMNQVFMNIIANAVDALKEKLVQPQNSESIGRIPRLHIRTGFVDQNTVKIQIADNGCGIPLEAQQKIFDPFFTTKPVGAGTGLGLSICYQIVEKKHQGRLSCNSTPGQGTEFTIEIPIHIPQSEASSRVLSRATVLLPQI